MIKRFCIENYKSIANQKVDLERFTVLVGPNGSGKSNFIDALAFMRDCLADSIELAFKNRGGIQAVRRIFTGHPTSITLTIDLVLQNGEEATYSFSLATKGQDNFEISHEKCGSSG